MDNPSLVNALGYIVVALIAGVVSIFIQRRMQPSQIANTAALTLSTLQGTLANVLSSQSLNLKDMDDLRKELAAVRKENEGLHEVAEAATKRAEAAEAAVVGLTKQVEDYPKRVIALEAIIEDLRTEIRRLQGVAGDNAAARNTEAATRSTEADTASTLANTAAAAQAGTNNDLPQRWTPPVITPKEDPTL